ncbi:MAG: cellulase family glycosylhydrolase [Proteobacteria bacterium]|nr:cellulase family glycosylhydrolase [Pseudomonadota bacterium]
MAPLAPAQSADPEALGRGINITAWFRFPASRDPAALAAYLSDQALADLRSAGFDFIRLAFDPDVTAGPAAEAEMITAIRRIHRQGMKVIVSPHPVQWRLEEQPHRLRALWRHLAPLLRPLDPTRTLPEVVNEPVYPNDAAGWAALQHAVLVDIRAALPDVTVVLTGNDWGSADALQRLPPEPDPNVIYSFHFYEPPDLTALAAYRSDLDRAALARLPFPANDRAACLAIGQTTDHAATREVIRYDCSLGWNEATLRRPIGEVAAWARAHGVRLLAGEFGASAALNPAARMAWLRTARTAFEAQGIAWALWGYDDIMGLAVPRPPPLRPELDPAVLAALGLRARDGIR